MPCRCQRDKDRRHQSLSCNTRRFSNNPSQRIGLASRIDCQGTPDSESMQFLICIGQLTRIAGGSIGGCCMSRSEPAVDVVFPGYLKLKGSNA
eukprot:765654-Hanusia_phi.AAC.2